MLPEAQNLKSNLGRSFNEIASLYDEIRPGYPPEIIEAIIAISGIPDNGRILEIGCGSGQITVPFAKRGYEILALEPGDALAAIAKQKCMSHPNVKFEISTFENWPLQPEAFDLVMSAQAFHWIDPEIAFSKTAAALKAKGILALVWHVDASESTPFYKATAPIYDRYFPQTETGGSKRILGRNARLYRDLLNESKYFEELQEVKHPWKKTFSRLEYLNLLKTYSDHHALSEPSKTQFFQNISDLIVQFGGFVDREFETVLLIAKKSQCPQI